MAEIAERIEEVLRDMLKSWEFERERENASLSAPFSIQFYP
jgi:hypothetical protein